jgi:hypothetical protein
MSSNRAKARHNSWYCCHKAPLLGLFIKPWFDRDHRSDCISESTRVSCPPTMLPISWGHWLPSFFRGRCRSLLPAWPTHLQHVTWNSHVRWNPHRFYIIIELLKVSVDLFALLNPRMSLTCNSSWPLCHKECKLIFSHKNLCRIYLFMKIKN